MAVPLGTQRRIPSHTALIGILVNYYDVDAWSSGIGRENPAAQRCTSNAIRFAQKMCKIAQMTP
jgi:hypothetical protein